MSGGEVWSLKRRQGEWHVCDENGLTVALCGDRMDDARSIVRDRQAFADMLAALRAIENATHDPNGELLTVRDVARAAIDKAVRT